MGSRRLWRALTALVAVVLAGVTALLAAPAAALARPAPVAQGVPASGLPGEELNELVEPSIVHLTVTWGGYVLYESEGGWIWSDPVEVSYGCSGFFVTETGHIMTAGHCVEPDSGKEEVIKAFLGLQVQQGFLTPADAEAILPSALLDWRVEGRGDGAPMTRVIQAVQPRAVDGAVITDPLNAQLIDFRPFEEGDLALLKVETTGAIPLPIAGGDPRSGSALTAVGFPGSVGQVVDVNLVRASFKTGTVSSTQVSATGVAQIEINADMSGGMSGGPTVDAVGNVLGVNSFGIRGEAQAFNFITDTSDLKEWLGAKNLDLPALRTAPAPQTAAPAAPPPAPPVASTGFAGLPLWVWIVIGALVVALIAAVVVGVTRSRRKGGGVPPAPGPHAPFPQAPHGQYPGARPPGYPQAPASWSPAPPAQDTPWLPRAQGPAQQGPAQQPAPNGSPSPAVRTAPPAGQAANASAPTVAYVKPDAVTTEAVKPATGACPGCGQPNGAAARFCSSCGTPLAGSAT